MKKHIHTPDDNPEWTKSDFARGRPASKVVSQDAAAALVSKGGRPPKPVDERKQQVTMRFAPDLLAEMRATGPGWQARAEEILAREFLPVKSPGTKGPMMSMRELMKDKRMTKASGVMIGRNAGSGRMFGRGNPKTDGGKKRA